MVFSFAPTLIVIKSLQMGAAYSTGPVGGGGQPPGGSGGGSVGRFPDGRSSNNSAGAHPLLDQSSFSWLNLARSGQLPPSSGVGAPSMRAQPQLPQQPQQQPQQQQQSAQSGIEELIANFSRANPNFLYSCECENLRAQQQQQQQQPHYQQATPQSQVLSGQVPQTSVSRSRSPTHHQQSPQTGVPRPSSDSLGGPGGQSTSGRPGSAASGSFSQPRIGVGSGNSGIKYGGGGNQSQQQTLPEQLVSAAAAAAAYPHRPSSSASASLRSSTTGSGTGYSVLPVNSTQFHPAYAAVAAASHLSHSDNLQDLTRSSGQPISSGGRMPPSKRPRLVSSSGSSVPPTSAAPSSSPYLSQSSSLSRQQQQQNELLLSRQLLQSAANNKTAILALFTNVVQQQQQQQAAASGGRTSAPSGYYQTSESYAQRSVGQRQPGSQLLVSSPNTLSQSSSSSSSSLAAVAAAAAAAYGNLEAAAAVAAAAQQQVASSAAAAAVANNTGVYHQQAAAAAAAGRSGYLHTTSSNSTTSSRGSYRGQPQQSQQITIPAGGGGGGGMGYHTHNTAHTMPGGSGVLRQQTKEPAYHPQVEAISPAPEEARLLDTVEAKLQREREEMQRRLHEIEARINKEEGHLRYLMDRESSLTADLKTETAAPPPNPHRTKALSVNELEDERAYENPIQADDVENVDSSLLTQITALLSETRSRAKRQHESLARLCGRSVSSCPCALPVYRQPSDLPALQHVQSVYKNGFRRQLIKYIHRRKRAERTRLRILAKHYARHAQAFFKRHEKLMNSAKRKQKDAKNREIFDKAFPEMKKIREDQGQKDGGKGEDGHDTGSNTGSNGADGDQAYDLVEDIAKMKEYAIDPPVTLAPWERSYHFLCTAHRITDPKSDHLKAQSLEKWSKEDRARFKERFLATPKNFTTIAASLDKTVAECIHYYYLSKKSEGYKALVKKHSTSRRRRTGHSDKNGPTGPSHGTASKKAPSRVSTPGGDDHRNSPHPDSKNEDSHTAGHRKGGGGGSSTRGRSGRRGGSGDHRSTKGSGRGRSGTPVPPPVSNTSSNTLGQPDTIAPDTKPTPVEVDRPQSSASALKIEDAKDNQTAPVKPLDSNLTKNSNGSSHSIKEKDEPKEAFQGGLKQTDEFSSSDGQVPSVPSLVYFHELLKRNVDKAYVPGINSNVQRVAETIVAPGGGGGGVPTGSMDLRHGYASPHHHPTSITDTVTLTHGSPASGTFSPHPHPEESAMNRPAFPDVGGITSGLLPQKEKRFTCGCTTNSADIVDAAAASCLAAALPEHLVNLAKGAMAAGSISPELLASIPQLSAVVASGAVYGTPSPSSAASTQALAQVLTQSMARAGGSQSPTQKPPHDLSNQSSDPAAAAYSKAILIGDFCTAQQLSRGSTPSQQAQIPTSANMTGTGLQRVADYTDPAYLSSRTIDPLTLPLPSKRPGPGRSTPGPSRSMGHGSSQGLLRSPPAGGGSSYHHQPPSLPPPLSRHRQIASHPSSSIDAGVSRQSSGRSLGALQGSVYASQASYGDTSVNKPSSYYDLPSINPPKKNSVPSINLDSAVSCRGGGGLDPKVEEYINHAAKLYQDEVERYTSRDRSDSMRTRTSSETSQQMHTALDNARQRVLGMTAATAPVENSSTLTGYTTPSVFANSVPAEPMGGMLDISEMLAKYGPQYLSLIAAATAAEANPSSTTMATSSSAMAAEGIPLFTPRSSKPSLMDRSAQLQPLPLPTSSASTSQFAPTPLHNIPQPMPLPRYRKSASGTISNAATTAASAGHPPSSSFSSPALSSQRDFFPALGDDNVSVGGFHPHHQQYHRYPTLMRASASRNLESVGLLPEELAKKASTGGSRSHQQLSPAASQSHSTTSQVPSSTSASNNPSLVISSFSATSAPISVAPNSTTISSFRSSDVSNTGVASSNSSITPVNTSASCTGTLGDQIEKAITDGIIVQQGNQDAPRINPSTAEAKSVKSIHPTSSLLKTDSENQGKIPTSSCSTLSYAVERIGLLGPVDLSPLLAPAARSSSASLLTSPSHIPASLSVFPKKRNRLTSSGSVGMGLARPTSPLRSREADTLTPQASSAVTTPSNASPTSTEGRPSVSKSPATAFVVSTTANTSMASGISTISPPSSAESPGNLQICIPPEDEQSQYSPTTPGEVVPGRPGSLLRQTSNSKSSNMGVAPTASPSHTASIIESTSPRHNASSPPPSPSSSSSSSTPQQQLPQSP
ncbi:Nuclear receptor corepressor 2 [Taenia solium]|eukprot:TsM_001107700 transcript=TsM_001107700 gene=TsM_001107700